MEPSKLEDTTVKRPFLSAAIAKTTSTTFVGGQGGTIKNARSDL